MPALRLLAAVWAGKLMQRVSRRAGRGGTALPGLIAERIDADVIQHLSAQLQASVLITGTNGKTTTARMTAAILEAAGRAPVHNRSGSNLMRGIAAALIDAAGPRGGVSPLRVGVFETDEATLPAAADAVRPRALAITNLLRDQLDRYGEIDLIRDRWRSAIRALPPETTLVLNADDPSVATLADDARGPVRLFGVDDAAAATPDACPAEHAADALWDPDSGTDYAYDLRFYAHLGHWRVPGGRARPAPHLRALRVQQDAAGASFDLAATAARSDERAAAAPVRLGLTGLYNVYNALAATSTAAVLGVGAGDAATALSAMPAAFGRQETLHVDGHAVRLLLGKNPAGMNAALHTLQQAGARHHLLVLLNDGVADGRDVSWIWDTDWEALAPHVASVMVGGKRAADMALRLAYAGLPCAAGPPPREIRAALDQALAALPPHAPLVVLPTYTAMLAVREQLGRMAGARGIWEGA